MHELDVGFLELLEDLVLGHKGPVLIHDLLDFVLWSVLDGPVLQLGLGQRQEGDDATLKRVSIIEYLTIAKPNLVFIQDPMS